MGYVFCELDLIDIYIKKERIVIAKKSTKSIIGRGWLSTLKYPIAPVPKGELEVNSEEKDQKKSVETKQFVKEFPKLFERRGKIENYKVKFILKTDAKIIPQKNPHSVAKGKR